MRIHEDLQIGTATHTGRVRRTNEDDYLILVPEDPEQVRQRGRLMVIADGMGGATGGAEASRAAVRAVARTFLEDGTPAGGEERMRQGFEGACRRVFALSRGSAILRGMGTTLTAINLLGPRLVLGHVGDTRCYLLRDGNLEQLTTDHALRKGENRLTRCVGGGRETEEADIVTADLRPGDRLLLATDGLWQTVDADELVRGLQLEPQAAAEHLVDQANRQGGPDNSTAVVVHVRHLGRDPGPLQDVELPAEEDRRPPRLLQDRRHIRRPTWPWLALLVSAVLAAVAVARFCGVDLLELLSGRG